MTATVALAVVGLAACGSSDNGSGGSPSGGSSGSGGTGGSTSGGADLSGASFTVGSKEFTESIILGKITEQVLEHHGAKVTDKTGISGSATVRKALTSGQIDMYWDYTGTGWVNYLKHTTKNVPQDLYAAVKKEDLAKNQVAWLKPAPFEDTYRIAVSHDFAEQNNLTTMSDAAAYIKAHPDDSAVCAASEFINRDDGLPGMEKAYGIKFSSVVELDLNLVYTQIGKKCPFGEVFSTDGRIVSQDLTVLDDDKNFFIEYRGALTMMDKTLQKYPQLATIMAPVSKALTDDAVTKMNSAVDVEGKKAEDVAKNFLDQQGLLK